MNYVDGFVVAVPTGKRDAYRAVAEKGARLFKDHGALEVIEAWGDDVPEGKVTSFPLAVKKTPDESVVFSWILWSDRAARDRGMKAAMDDPRMAEMSKNTPFDGKRMIFGGFQIIVDA
jgi:uncharacterized protein YbaA (DUF1428 family)